MLLRNNKLLRGYFNNDLVKITIIVPVYCIENDQIILWVGIYNN